MTLLRRILGALCAAMGVTGLLCLAASPGAILVPSTVVLGLVFTTALAAGLAIALED